LVPSDPTRVGTHVITGELSNKADRVWVAFRSDRLSSPLAEKEERVTRVSDAIIVGPDAQDLICSRFTHGEPAVMCKAEAFAEKMNGAGFDAIVVAAKAV
jgi:hypothetical protein